MVVKGSKSWPRSAGFRLATMLLVGWGSAASSGCLLPQEDQVFPFIPDSRNLPPLILDTGRRPVQQRSPIQVGPSCSTEFVIFVQDESPTIQHQWFVDPKPTHIPSGRDGTPQTGTATTRRELRPPSGLFTDLAIVADKNEHLVEVVITDGVFKETTQLEIASNEVGRDETGDAGQKTPYSVSFTWFGAVTSCP